MPVVPLTTARRGSNLAAIYKEPGQDGGDLGRRVQAHLHPPAKFVPQGGR